jgi:outer membrane protein, heavy metal efflux system
MKTLTRMLCTFCIHCKLYIAGAVMITIAAAQVPAAAQSVTAVQVEVATDTYPELLEYIRIALEQNAELGALESLNRAQAEKSREAGTLPDPEVGLGYDLNPAMWNSVPGRFSVSVMQMFPWFGSLETRREMELAMAETGRSEIGARTLEVIADLQLLWFEIAELRAVTGLMEENLQLVRDLEKLVEVRYETGRAGQADILRIQMEEQRIRTRIADLNDRIVPLKASFNALLNREPGAEVATASWTTSETHVGDIMMTPDEARERVLAGHPVFEGYAAREQWLDLSNRMARLDGLPMFGLGLEVMGRDFGAMSMNPDATESFIAMATIRLPVWRSRTRSQQAQIAEQRRALQYQREQSGNELASAVEAVYEEHRRAGRSIALLENELIPRARQAMEILREEYTAGNVRFDELLQIRRELLDLEVERTQALAMQNRAVAKLAALTGSQYQQFGDK